MALVDTLEYFPEQHPGRARLLTYLQSLADIVVLSQDETYKGWYKIMDGEVFGVFPSTSHCQTSCSSSLKGFSCVRQVVDSLYNHSGRVSLMIIVVSRPLTNGVSVQNLTVFASPNVSIEASNLMA